jgi:hypothetical protein
MIGIRRLTELGRLISDLCLDVVVEIIETPDWIGEERKGNGCDGIPQPS